MTDEQLFAAGCAAAEQQGNLLIEIGAVNATCLIAIIQLACRHPGLRGSESRKYAERFARTLQEELGRRNADLGRLLERGWHKVFDVDSLPSHEEKIPPT